MHRHIIQRMDESDHTPVTATVTATRACSGSRVGTIILGVQVQLVLMKLVPVLVVVMVLFDSISGTAITTQVLVVVMVLFDSIREAVIYVLAEFVR